MFKTSTAPFVALSTYHLANEPSPRDGRGKLLPPLMYYQSNPSCFTLQVYQRDKSAWWAICRLYSCTLHVPLPYLLLINVVSGSILNKSLIWVEFIIGLQPSFIKKSYPIYIYNYSIVKSNIFKILIQFVWLLKTWCNFHLQT